MNIAISSLAYDNGIDDFLNILKLNKINFIELVFQKIQPWEKLTNDEITNFSLKLDQYGVKIKSAQSLFFNSGCNNTSDTDSIINHIKKIITLSKPIGINTLVFGSPNLRKKYDGYEKDLELIFKSIDSELNGTDISLVIEPNSKIYGGDYFFNLDEIVKFITDNDLKNVYTMIDTHNLLLENKLPSVDYIKYKNYIKHIHVSEEGLLPYKSNNEHKIFSEILKKNKYDGLITYEVKPHSTLNESINAFLKIYSND